MLLKQLNFQQLREDQYGQIEETALRIVEDVGIWFQHHQATEMLDRRGYVIEGKRVFITRDVVAWSLAYVDRNAALRCVYGRKEVFLGAGRFATHNGGSVIKFEDLETEHRRPTRLQDLIDGARILNASPNINMVISLVEPQDVPEELISSSVFEAMLHHTHKSIGGAAVKNLTEVCYMVEQASVRHL